MLPENAIEVKSISKSFKLYFDKGTTLKEKVLFKKRRAFEERKVLDNVSFFVRKGEAVGLIGHNGCGKSTTLKLLTRIMYPDSGSIEMKGRVSSLIELGAGFHPDMTGRENIYINASIFGLTKKEIDKRVNDIIAFSELGQYIDNPVRTYSSGMYMRLAFSVAINVDAEILLIDEILAVGDANFQAKCFNKLRDIKKNGTSIVIVSHALTQIEQICERTLWINDGKIEAQGSPSEVHPQYLDFMGRKQGFINHEDKEEILEEDTQEESKEQGSAEITEKNQEIESESDETVMRWGNGKSRITSVQTYDIQCESRRNFCTGETIILKIGYEVKEPVYNATFGIGVFRADGLSCYGVNTYLDKLEKFDLLTDGVTTVVLKNVNLLPAEYWIDIAIQADISEPIDYFRDAYRIQMYSTKDDVGVCRIDHSWEIDGNIWEGTL